MKVYARSNSTVSKLKQFVKNHLWVKIKVRNMYEDYAQILDVDNKMCTYKFPEVLGIEDTLRYSTSVDTEIRRSAVEHISLCEPLEVMTSEELDGSAVPDDDWE